MSQSSIAHRSTLSDDLSHSDLSLNLFIDKTEEAVSRWEMIILMGKREKKL